METILPKDDNGLPLGIFLVTVKNILDENIPTARYVVFANNGLEAHQKINEHYNTPTSEFAEGSRRVTTEMVRIASGKHGIIEL